MRTRLLLTCLSLAALLPASADAAGKPRPIRVVAKTNTSLGPVLAGGRVLWVRSGYDKATIGVASRRSKYTAQTLEAPRYADAIRMTDLAASRQRTGYAGAEEEFEIRDAFDNAYFYGTLRSRGTDHQSFGRCHDLDPCWRDAEPHIEASGDAVAWGPFGDISPQRGSQNILVKDYAARAKPAGAIVPARSARDIRMAGRFIAYSRPSSIVLVDWRDGEGGRQVRELPVPGASFSFDVDPSGRVAVAWATSSRRTAYGVFGSDGRLRRFRTASAGRSEGNIWIANRRVAFGRVVRSRGKSVRTWQVTTLSGRAIATMRPRARAQLADFDGSCLAWAQSRRAIYVAAVGKAPRSSICRR